MLQFSSVNLDGSGSVTSPTVKMVRLYNTFLFSQILENTSKVKPIQMKDRIDITLQSENCVPSKCCDMTTLICI